MGEPGIVAGRAAAVGLWHWVAVGRWAACEFRSRAGCYQGLGRGGCCHAHQCRGAAVALQGAAGCQAAAGHRVAAAGPEAVAGLQGAVAGLQGAAVELQVAAGCQTAAEHRVAAAGPGAADLGGVHWGVGPELQEAGLLRPWRGGFQ